MSFVNLALATQKQVFDVGTVGGDYQYWITDSAGETVAGPATTPNTSIVLEVEDSLTKDQLFTAYAVRLDDAGNEIGPQVETPFTLGITFVILDVASSLAVNPVPTPL